MKKIAAIVVGVVLAVLVLLMVIPSDEESGYMEEATTGEEASMIGSAETDNESQEGIIEGEDGLRYGTGMEEPVIQSQLDEEPDKKVRIKRAIKSYTKYDRYGNVLGDEFSLFRNNLSDSDQRAYDYIYNELINGNLSFNMGTIVYTDNIDSITSSVFNDNPELCWIDYSFNYNYNNDGQITSISFSGYDIANDVEGTKQSLEAAAEPILAQAETIDSTPGKIKYIHDYLTNKNDYVSGCTYNQSAYSALVLNQTVCSGYSRAFQYLMQKLGIPCEVILGDAGGSHSWDIVYCEGTYYCVDVTWDDPIGNPAETYYTTYLLVSDSQLSSQSTRSRTGSSQSLPQANENYNGEFNTATGAVSPVYSADNSEKVEENNYEPQIEQTVENEVVSISENEDSAQQEDAEENITADDQGMANGAFDYVWNYNEWMYDEEYEEYYMEFSNGIYFFYDSNYDWYYIQDAEGNIWGYDSDADDFYLTE